MAPLNIFISLSVTSLFALTSLVSSSSHGWSTEAFNIVRRQASVSAYAPDNGSCPSTRPVIRAATSLSEEETSWLKTRRTQSLDSMQQFLSRAAIPDFDVRSYFSSHGADQSALPNIGLTFSGGGYRALLNGAGAVKAFDSRTAGSTDPGGLGGVLQSATYIAGLSGGSWLLGSIYINNFTTIQALQDQSQSGVWHFQNNAFEGPKESGLQIFNTGSFLNDLRSAISSKSSSGFNVSITDFWGRALSYQFFEGTNGNPSATWSGIAQMEAFSNGSAPFPIIEADYRAPGTIIVPLNSTNYEFNPFEMGSWDPTLFAFAPTKYLGSPFDGGNVPDNEECVTGFDRAGFAIGTSSSLFNYLIPSAATSSLPAPLSTVLNYIYSFLPSSDRDVAIYKPNPFYRYHSELNSNADTRELTLVDGGEDLQNIPFNPLIQPVRNVDVIFAIDSSADTENNFPNGTAIVATYTRSRLNGTQANGTTFASIPGQNTFVNLGLNQGPVFFGCDSHNTSSASPLIVYLPNNAMSFYSNISTLNLTYTDQQRDAVIANGYDVVTLANGTVGANATHWASCVGCAMLSRSFERTNNSVPARCKECFLQYCWNGTVEGGTPPPYDPRLKAGGGGGNGSKTGGGSGNGSGTGASGSSSGASARTVEMSIWGMLLTSVAAAATWLM